MDLIIKNGRLVIAPAWFYGDRPCRVKNCGSGVGRGAGEAGD